MIGILLNIKSGKMQRVEMPAGQIVGSRWLRAKKNAGKIRPPSNWRSTWNACEMPANQALENDPTLLAGSDYLPCCLKNSERIFWCSRSRSRASRSNCSSRSLTWANVISENSFSLSTLSRSWRNRTILSSTKGGSGGKKDAHSLRQFLQGN